MSQNLNRASNVRAPHDIGQTANDFQEYHFTCPTNHAANAVPSHFKGQYVRLYATAECYFAFSTNSAAEVDSTPPTATAAGENDKVGRLLPATTEMHVLVPDSPDTVYFVREGQASCQIFMGLASGS